MDLLTGSVSVAEYDGEPYTVVALVGEADATTRDRLRTLLNSAMPGEPQRLFVDLSELQFIDSTGVQVLIQTHWALDAQGGSMALIAPRGGVARILRLAEVEEVMPVYASVAEAAAAP